MIAVLVMGLVTGLASMGAAQIVPKLIPLPPNPIVITWPSPNMLVEITAGASHTCVRKYNGMVYCWGDDGLGQVGVSSTATCTASPIGGSSFLTSPCVDKPNYVTQLVSPAQVVAGSSHTCALNGGIAECWGSDVFGELGDGNAGVGLQRTMAQNVSMAPVFTTLAAGPSVTCGMGQSGVYCWGKTPFGSQQMSANVKPTMMYDLTSSGAYTSLTVGSQFACFNATSSYYNELDCSGLDQSEQLGISITTPLQGMQVTCNPDGGWSTPIAPPPCANGLPPLQFIGFLNGSSLGSVVRPSAGATYLCADMSNGTVECVGNNVNGKLGGSDWAVHRANPMPVAAAGGASLQLHGVTTGDTHACALDANGYAWCWGSGQYGELGT